MNQITPVKDEHSVIHSTFTIERTYPQSPAQVFHAFADKATVRRWRVDGDGFAIAEFSFDFRIGGGEVSRFSYAGGPEVRLDAQFQDIVPDQRIVFSYRMANRAAANVGIPYHCRADTLRQWHAADLHRAGRLFRRCRFRQGTGRGDPRAVGSPCCGSSEVRIVSRWRRSR